MMTDVPNKTAEGWIIGISDDKHNGRLGLVAHHYRDPTGRHAIRVNWQPHGDQREIAERLHDLANTLEREASTYAR